MTKTFVYLFDKKIKDVVLPCSSIFYRILYIRRKINKQDNLYEALKKYRKNNKLTLEKRPLEFLDSKLLINNGIYETQVYRKKTKIPTHWSSSIPKKYKRNAISVDLHRSKQISSNYDTEVQIIKS